jgi:hypothetical protein
LEQDITCVLCNRLRLPPRRLRPILNFDPRGKLWHPGAKLSPGGEILCLPLHSSKQLSVFIPGSILVCKIFMILAEIVDEIFGRNENWILVYFSSKFLAKMRDTRIQCSFRSKISSAILAKI